MLLWPSTPVVSLHTLNITAAFGFAGSFESVGRGGEWRRGISLKILSFSSHNRRKGKRIGIVIGE